MMHYDENNKIAPPNGWNEEHIAILEEELQRAKAQGESLRPAFERTALRTGRKPNSIRNYYYTTYRASKGQRAGRSFELFSPDEVEQLLMHMLSQQAKGKSVRRAAMELGNFDHSAMLRYQNKYRSLVRTRPDEVRRVMAKLKAQGVPCFDPYAESLLPCAMQDADEKQLEHVIGELWNDVHKKLLLLPRQKALQVVQGVTALFDAAVPDESLAEENRRLVKENRGLLRQIEMISMPIDGDILADGGMTIARRAAQQYDLLQNTSKELAVFMPKNEE